MSFTTGSTPFGAFDSDTSFQTDADKVLTYVQRRLGDPVMCVELSSSQVYTCFEEATLEFSAIMNQYQAKSVLATVLGRSTGSLSGQEQRFPQKVLEFQRRMAQGYAAEANVGGNQTLHSSSITLNVDQQTYDLQTLINPTGSDGNSRRMIIQDVYHTSPTAAFRFFGTTSAVNYLNNQFSFESFTPETIFYLLPIWEDILRGMQFETSNRVRRSNYSYELHNNVLKVYPAPVTSLKLFFTYRLAPDPFSADSTDLMMDGVANLANVPFGNISYSKLNSISKQWIWKMTYALSKETLGLIRSKMNTIPIPNGDLTLNGPELINDARAEMEVLRGDLKAMLDETTYDKLMMREAEMAEFLNRTMTHVPLLIYTGAFVLFVWGTR